MTRGMSASVLEDTESCTHLGDYVVNGFSPLCTLFDVGVQVAGDVQAVVRNANTEVVLQVQAQIRAGGAL